MTFKGLMRTLKQLEELGVDMEKPALVDSHSELKEVKEVVTLLNDLSNDSYISVYE